MRMDLPAPVLHVLFALNEAEYEAFVVGGCVRDTLNDEIPIDWDITTSAMPEQILAVFQNERTIETGIQHGTVTVIVEDMPLEITTYRVDGKYTDGRHPDRVSFTRSLQEDLRRRDFTVNAMAYHPCVGLVDPFHGQRDLKKRIVRCVGRPKRRFTEDALRILRGLRFSAVLNFSIHPATSKAIHSLAGTLTNVSAERLSVEFTKLLCGVNVKPILCDYADVLSVVLPGVNFVQAATVVSAVTAKPLCRYAALMFELSPKQTESCCKRLRLSNRMTEELIALVRHRQWALVPTKSCILHTLHRLGPSLTRELIHLRSVVDRQDYGWFGTVWNQLAEENACCYRLKDLAVTGADLMAVGIPSGPRIGATLSRLLDAVMDGDCPNNKEELLKLAINKPVR